MATESTSLQKAYDTYKSTAAEPFFSAEEFANFWTKISVNEQAWWYKQFCSGFNLLTKQLLIMDDAEKNSGTELHPSIQEAVQDEMERERLMRSREMQSYLIGFPNEDAYERAVINLKCANIAFHLFAVTSSENAPQDCTQRLEVDDDWPNITDCIPRSDRTSNHDN